MAQSRSQIRNYESLLATPTNPTYGCSLNSALNYVGIIITLLCVAYRVYKLSPLCERAIHSNFASCALENFKFNSCN